MFTVSTFRDKVQKYTENLLVLPKVLSYTMLYAPQFSHTPLYSPQNHYTDTMPIVIDGNRISF